MTKLSRKNIDSSVFGHYVNNLWSAFTLMDTKEDIRLLFKDLFTHTEYKMLAKRLEIARRLLVSQGYQEISRELGVTSRTITVISNVLAVQGEGLRKACAKLAAIGKEIRSSKRTMALSPIKIAKSTVLGAALRAGAVAADRKIKNVLKHRSAKQELGM
ncbi:MAG: Trp family transcriptional regulator [bacterium]|nr:Trp family transcriptional regulator [bacterium]